MVHKRYIKKGGKTYGPYYYKNVRDSQGNVKSIYLGSKKEEKKPVVQKKIPFLLGVFFIFIILSGLYFGVYTGNFIGLGDVPLSELNDQIISKGDTFSVDVKSTLRAAYFTDDSDLFDISPEGEINFKAKEIGEYSVAIIAKSEEGFEYNIVTFTIE